MTTVTLDRRFFEWRNDGLSDPDLLARWGRSKDLMPWDAVLERRRVVLLAEAGSGKTAEMREQVRLRSTSDQFAVYATVEDVGRDGLEGALGASDRARLATWRAADDEGWFFIDSVDEARLGQLRLERALRQIADGILGTERRAHIVMSCRLTDWQTSRDLERLKEALPIPRDPSPPPPPAPDELLVRVLHARGPVASTTASESPLVVLMAPLDEERVRLFVAAKAMPDMDSFIRQIEAGNLWRFTRRPLDLDWLVDFWREHRRLGSLAEMLETGLSARVLETNNERAVTIIWMPHAPCGRSNASVLPLSWSASKPSRSLTAICCGPTTIGRGTSRNRFRTGPLRIACGFSRGRSSTRQRTDGHACTTITKASCGLF